MPYSNFTFSTVKKMFELSTVKNSFAILNQTDNDRVESIEEVLVDDAKIENLLKTIDYNLPLATAISTKKARSELSIVPVLLTVRKLLNDKISLFSGVEFNVNEKLQLNGICDYIISKSSEQYCVEVPVLTIAEAKEADLNLGMGKVIAEMVAFQQFNRESNLGIKNIYGCVSNGTHWRFLRLEDRNLHIDNRDRYLYPIEDLVETFRSILSN